MEDFRRQYAKDHFALLTPQEQREALQRLSPEHRREILRSLSPEELLGVLSAEQIREYLEQRTAARPSKPRTPRRKR
jgi:Mg/Co/Ni transporter MgtE